MNNEGVFFANLYHVDVARIDASSNGSFQSSNGYAGGISCLLLITGDDGFGYKSSCFKHVCPRSALTKGIKLKGSKYKHSREQLG